MADYKSLKSAVDSLSTMVEVMLPTLQGVQNAVIRVEKKISSMEDDIARLNEGGVVTPTEVDSRCSDQEITARLKDEVGEVKEFVKKEMDRLEEASRGRHEEVLTSLQKSMSETSDLKTEVQQMKEVTAVVESQVTKLVLGQSAVQADLKALRETAENEAKLFCREVQKQTEAMEKSHQSLATELTDKLQGLPRSDDVMMKDDLLPVMDAMKSVIGSRHGATPVLEAENIKIHIKTPEGPSTSLDVRLSHTVWDVKNLYQTRVGTSASEITLLFEDKLLGDDASLESCGIKMWSTLNIGINISVKVSADKTLSLAVLPTYYIRNVKAMIRTKGTIVDEELLNFNCKYLDDESRLSDYGIKAGDILKVASSLTEQEKAKSMKVGARVKRGRDWDVSNKSDGGGLGTVTEELYGVGYVKVRWDNGREGGYFMGYCGQYWLQLA